jgi:type II secretory pathway pseudopilin PulG
MQPRGQGGFTYLAILFAVAVLGTGLAAVGEMWSTASRRDKERELLHAGRELRAAIAAYYEQSPGGLKRYPPTLGDLLKDGRLPGVKRHLRRPLRDPITGKPEWGLIMSPLGGIMGVHSLAEDQPLKTASFAFGEEAFVGKKKYSEWRFTYMPTANPRVIQTLPTTQQAKSVATPAVR